MIEGSLHDKLGKARRYLPQYMRYFTDATSRDMRDAVKDFTHVDTGELKASIETLDTNRRITGTGIQVWTGGTISRLQRASYSEYDTAPHVIKAKTKAGLRFFDRGLGVSVAREEVFHPGTTGVHMFAKGADLVQSTIVLKGEAMLKRWRVKNEL